MKSGAGRPFFMNDNMQAHYHAFLAGRYCRASGGMEDQTQKNQEFFSPMSSYPPTPALPLIPGPACGFQSVAPAAPGYPITAVDFCQPLMDELRIHAGTLQIVTVLQRYPYLSLIVRPAPVAHGLHRETPPTRLPRGTQRT
jgi:hypothetical protein